MSRGTADTGPGSALLFLHRSQEPPQYFLPVTLTRLLTRPALQISGHPPPRFAGGTHHTRPPQWFYNR